MKNLGKLSKHQLEKEIEKASDKSSEINRAFIDAGRGYEKYAEIKQNAERGDQLAKRYITAHNEYRTLIEHQNERHRLGDSFVREQARKLSVTKNPQKLSLAARQRRVVAYAKSLGVKLARK